MANVSRKKMRKEITKTTISFGRIVMKKGVPSVEETGEVTAYGNLNLQKALEYVSENVENGKAMTIFDVNPTTDVYEADVMDFISIAKIIKPKEESFDESVGNTESAVGELQKLLESTVGESAGNTESAV